jgi:hypothetical protein
VGVTVVSAAERDQRSAAVTARRLDARHAVLAATSVFAILAIALAVSGRVQADAFTAGAQHTAPPINVNTVTDASALTPLLAPVFTDPADRQRAAARLFQFILSRREQGDELPNVGLLLDVKGDDGRTVLTRSQLAVIKPLAAVRTIETHRGQRLDESISCVSGPRRSSGGGAAFAVTINCSRPRTC